MSKEDFLNPDGSWKCIKCGACCYTVATAYPHLDRNDGTGRCIHLTEENLCAIYENRPELCRVPKALGTSIPDKMAEACDLLRTVFLGGESEVLQVPEGTRGTDRIPRRRR